VKAVFLGRVLNAVGDYVFRQRNMKLRFVGISIGCVKVYIRKKCWWFSRPVLCGLAGVLRFKSHHCTVFKQDLPVRHVCSNE